MATNFAPAPEDPEFEQFWKHYPRKVKKGDARRAWFQVRSLRPPTPQLIKSVIVQSASDQWRQDGGRYIPHPSTWLRAEQWEDSSEIELAQVSDGKMWWETNSGIEAKAKEVGISWDARSESYRQFVERIKRSVNPNVVQIDQKTKSAGA